MVRLDQPDLKTIEHAAQQLQNCISFAQGALRVGGVDPAIREHISTLMATDKADYYSHSLGIAALRQRLAASLTAQYNTPISYDNVIISHGSINGIAALALLLLEAGDEVLLPEPTYPPYVNIITLAKAQVRFLSAYKQEIRRDGTIGWTLDRSMLEAARTSKTKMLIFSHPSNPCGVCLTQEELNEVAAWCEQHGIYLIVDEAYENYFFDAPISSATPLVPDSQFIIRAGSFSKTFGMSGWRIGYVVAPKKIIEHIGAVQDGLIACPSVIGQYAALYALEHPLISQTYTNIIHANRDIAHQALEGSIERGIITCAKPPAGFFLFIQTREHNTATMAQQMLTQAQVAIVPGKDFGPSGKQYLRLCYARPRDTLEQGLERFITYLNKTA